MWQNTAYMVRLAWQSVKSVPLLCAATAALAVGNSLLELFVAPVILGRVEAAVPVDQLLLAILGFAGALIFAAALRAYTDSNVMYGRIGVRLKLLLMIHKKFCTMSYPLTEDPETIKQVERAGRAVAGNSQPTEAVWTTLTNLLQNGAGFVIYLLLLTALDPLLIAVVLVTTVAGYLVNRRVNEWSYRHRKEQDEYGEKMWYIATKAEDIKLAKDIRMFGLRSWLEDLYRINLRLYRGFIAKREKRYLLANAVDGLLALLRNGAAYFFLIGMTLRDGLPASQFLLYFTAVSGFTAWVTGILNELSTLHKQCLEISAVREFLELPEPFRLGSGEPVQAESGLPYEIAFEHVSFRYPGADRDILHDVSLTIPAGEKLAVVGLNGAGKTTLVKLLCGFYDPTEGRVLLNGRDIREFDRRAYYRLFSAVFQDFSVLEASVRENVAQTDAGVDGEKVRDCLDKAGLTEKVESLPQGPETHIGRKVFEDGVELSGGETQRLMLARALYKNGPILVLDEPTAALDPIAENDIYLKYSEMTAGRTSVFISHRLASTRFCDRILFIADGGVAEEGDHESLLELGGRYAELFQVQSRYYQKEQEGAEQNG